MTQVRPGSTGRRGGAVAAAAALTLCAVLAAVAADTAPDEPVRLADILTGPDGLGSYPSELTKAGDRVVFAASSGEPDSPSSDREVWVTDGTAEGTYRLADIWPGTSGSDPRTFVGDGTRVWFTAMDGTRTRDLWVTDGTPGGTTKVTSMPEGSMGVGRHVAIHGGDVWFIADDGVHGLELWKTDGSPGGESLVADIIPGADSPDIYELRSFGGRMYFTCNDGVRGIELWSSDGTAAGTDIVIDLNPAGSSNLQELTPWNGELWFRAETPEFGYELWATDGTAAGTRLVKDMWPGDYSGFPIDFEPAGDVMYFAGQATWTGYELWRTDGTTDGTWLVRDIYPGSGGSAHELTLSGGLLYFGQNEPGTGQFELWRSDGTYDGTWQLTNTVHGGANPGAITPFGTGVVFSADDGVHGYELWRSDGTAEGTYMIRDHVPGPDGGGNGYPVAVPGGIVYGGKGGAAGFELCRSDGTEQGTYVLANLSPGARSSISRSSATHRVGVRAVFLATDEDGARAPFASDGTPGGTSSLRSSANGPPTWDSQYGIVSRGMLWFAGDSAAQGRELWVTDGTVVGTRLVKDLAVGASGSYPELDHPMTHRTASGPWPSKRAGSSKATALRRSTRLQFISLFALFSCGGDAPESARSASQAGESRVVSPHHAADFSVTLPGGVSMDFVRVPPAPTSSDTPEHRPTGRPQRDNWFLMAQTEVTHGQWVALMAAQPTPAARGSDHPAEGPDVSWSAVAQYLDRLTSIAGEFEARLPTPAQWEFACRAGSSGPWCFGSSEATLPAHAHYAGSRASPSGTVNYLSAAPVRTRLPNRWGLYDMHGNVAEMCTESIAQAVLVAPESPRLSMGGSVESAASEVRCDARRVLRDAGGLQGVGFRPILVPR